MTQAKRVNPHLAVDEGRTMRNLKRNAALIASTAVIASAGVGGVMAAQANSSSSGDSTDESSQTDVEETSDGPDQGPDANPNEPGHQDADESGEGQ